MVSIIVKNGNHAGQEFAIHGPECLIGRGPQCHVRLSDRTVSRQHARILWDSEQAFSIVDEHSKTGTYVNGKRITRSQLPHRASMMLGTVQMEFRCRQETFDFSQEEAAAIDEETGSHYTVLHVLSGEDPVLVDAAEPVGEEMGPRDTARVRLKTAYDLTEAISTTFELDRVYQEILKAVFSTLRVQRATILLADSATKEIRPCASKTANDSDRDVPFSSTIVQKVMETGTSLLLHNAQSDDSLDDAQSVIVHNIRSVICVPIRSQKAIIGVLNADAAGSSIFTDADLQLLTFIGNQAGIAIQNAWLIEENIASARLAAVGQAMASLAHGIKNILQGLEGGSSMIDQALKTGNDQMLHSAWPLVQESQQRITELVLNMLDFSKDREPAYEEADLLPHLKNVYDLIRLRAAKRNIEITFDFHPETPHIMCDPEAIHRATLNLMTNALDAVAKETGRVKLEVFPIPQDEHVAICVVDNGPGIPDDLRDAIFDAFLSTKNTKGTGLGLAVTKKVVEEHHGTVHVESGPDGSTFLMRIPIKKPAASGG